MKFGVEKLLRYHFFVRFAQELSVTLARGISHSCALHVLQESVQSPLHWIIMLLLWQFREIPLHYLVFHSCIIDTRAFEAFSFSSLQTHYASGSVHWFASYQRKEIHWRLVAI